MDANLHSVDALRFQGMATYKDRLKKYQEATGLIDAVLSGYGLLEGGKVAIAVMDFTFLAATMGSVVGERVTRMIEFATAERIAVIIISASGGARMYEGMLSLMQMAKTSGALARHADARLPYISVLTNPTTAGVMASYASLGDIIIAEPKSMIGFAGSRVNYREALAWLYATQRFGIKLGLENIERLLHSLSIDFARLNLGSARASRAVSGVSPETIPFRVIHVAGTHGKGSVCAMIDAIARAAGYRTGLFTSPHLVSFRERVRVNGEKMSEDKVAGGLTEIRELIGSWDPHPTFFEIATALALQHFQTTRCEILVLETGMGGRLDATNAVQSSVSVITPIDFDHEKWLGQSIDQIAKEKAGIIKPRIPVISAPQRPEAEVIIRQHAEECDAPLRFVNDPWTKTRIALRGEHQKMNAALAIAALQAADIQVSDDAIARGLSFVKWPARFQIW